VIAWLVLELTDSKLLMGITNSLSALPIILLSLFGGVISDRFDRRTILVRSRVSLMGLSLLTAFLITAQVVELWHILLLVVLAGGEPSKLHCCRLTVESKVAIEMAVGSRKPNSFGLAAYFSVAVFGGSLANDALAIGFELHATLSFCVVLPGRYFDLALVN